MENAMSKVRVLLVDDHTLVRAGIRKLLENIDGIQVVAEADDGSQVVELVRVHRPDLVLMDISMKTQNGIDATVQLKAAFPDIRVIILSMHTDREHVARALRAGACGYLLKDAAAIDLGLALASVLRGETYLSPRVSKQMVDNFVDRPGVAQPVELTVRQREILRLIAKGRATKTIAHELGISAKTVEAHRMQLMKRLGIRDIAGLVRYAIRAGLISADE